MISETALTKTDE